MISQREVKDFLQDALALGGGIAIIADCLANGKHPTINQLEFLSNELSRINRLVLRHLLESGVPKEWVEKHHRSWLELSELEANATLKQMPQR